MRAIYWSSVCSHQKDQVMLSSEVLFVVSLNKLVNKDSSIELPVIADVMTLIWLHCNAGALNYARTNSLRLSDAYMRRETIIGSDNGLSLWRRQVIIWTSAGTLLIGPLGTSFSEILIGIQTFLFNKMHLKMSSGKWRPSCLGFNALNNDIIIGVDE